MNFKYLNELERNLEIQAHSFLLQKEDSLFESQTRTEFNQILLVNRLKSQIGKFTKVYLTDLSLFGEIIEISMDHLVVEENEFRYLIKMNQILYLENLTNWNCNLTRFEEKWNFKSSLRDLLLKKTIIQIKITNGQILLGYINNCFNDHFDLMTDCKSISIQTNHLLWIKFKDNAENSTE